VIKDSKALLVEIEESVRKRAILPAKKSISEYLKREHHRIDARIIASDFYRRISDPCSALKVLGSEEERDPKLRFQLSRILNSLGGSHYAMRILSSFHLEDLAAHRIPAVEIFLSNYHYCKAFELMKNVSLRPDSSYSERSELISKAAILQGLGKTQEAVELVDELLAVSSEPLIRAVLFQAKGAYLILNGDFVRAGESLLESESLFSPHDKTLERSHLDKWLGAFFIFKREPEKARKYLNRSWKILYKPGYKPEEWLEVLYWKGRLTLLQKKEFPEEWVRINAYPQPPKSRILQWIRSEMLLPHAMTFGEEKILRQLRTRHLDLESKIRFRKTHIQYDLNLSEHLISRLIIAGKYGMPLFRLSETLWPDELFSFQSNLKRLEQMVIRARKEEKFKIRWKDLQLYSNGNKEWSCFWSENKRITGALFLDEHPEFLRADVERFFRLSPRRALQVCESWKNASVIEQVGRTKSARYQKLINQAIVKNDE